MKKLVLVLAIVFAGVMSANAQGWWVGGGLGANVQKNFTQFTISPELGYVINDQFQVALGAGYTYANGNANLLYLQPYFRYVGGTIGKKFSLFADLCGDFGLIDADGYAVTIQPGVAWQATEKFTAAFRFGKVGYDHGIYGVDGFLLQCALVAPEIRIYYNF